MDVDPIIEIFREEARDHLAALEKLFLDLETSPQLEARRALIDDLFRHAHSMKSDAKVVGVPTLKEAAQSLEDMLDDLRENPQRIDQDAIDQGLSQFDAMRAAFETWQVGFAQPDEEEPADDPPDRFAAETGDVRSTPPPVVPAPSAGPPGPGRVEPSGQSSAAAFPVGPAAASSASDQEKSPQEEVSPEAALAATDEERFTVRVPSQRLDRMLNLAGEVRVCQRNGDVLSERMLHLREHLQNGQRELELSFTPEQKKFIEGALDQTLRIETELRTWRTREELLIDSLEDEVRQARLLPLSMLTEALRRAVRDLAQSLGKSIRYEAVSGEILLDKAVLEALRSPLLHLLRNAADHGIESPAQRVQAGKPESGVISISAVQSGPLVRITIADDGCGVNFPRVRERLSRSGEFSREDLERMPQSELIAQLFRPGFSTAAAGEISGRGVGLDAAADTLRRLHGNIELRSTSPQGSAFALTVPITVSSVRIMTVLAGGRRFGIPTSNIRRTGRARREELQELDGSQVLTIDGASRRFVHLATLLGAEVSPQSRHASAWSYLLAADHEGEIVVAVDDLIDESEVLLKPLGFPLNDLDGVLGAAVRSDGSVELVLDLLSPAWRHLARRSPVAAPQPSTSGRLLVVDDSPTTRAVLRKVFTAAGYTVATACDGGEALELLASRTIDLVVSDVEMPRLNGFDLTRQIKARYGLPVILVTGREKEEHRRAGLDAGADAYVVKSTFEDQGLLELVEQFV
ncbi:hybrid sensor histidine kinase/response regulator [Lignipirellula cremea]|uniref:histidine kinase n=1 Tax=Lignipirellula cremea TaxID=2528010 RepID=A0A518DTI3_9BACT|nr:response regulator [Lignipirellula cremea]QDU95144.1 Chemotaxis protein CheA [Lignipirellula cremea]